VLNKLLTDLCDGKGREEYLQMIEDIAETMKEASLCALGTTAANPVLTALKYFRNEYEAHIKGECPAKICKALTAYYIDPEKCQACMICMRNCPANAIKGEKEIVHVIDQEKCTKCGICYASCPFDAVKKISPPTPPAASYGLKVKRKR